MVSYFLLKGSTEQMYYTDGEAESWENSRRKRGKR